VSMHSYPVSKNKARFEEWRTTLDNEHVRSPCIPIDIPTETLLARTLRCLREHAALHPSRPAVIDGFDQDRFFTYQQTHDKALSVASFLQSRGFGVGDRAMTVLPNCIEIPLIHLGVWGAGGTFLGCSATYKHDDMVYQLKDSATSVVFTEESLVESVLKAVEECPEVKLVVCIRSSSSPLPESVVDFQEAFQFPQMENVDLVTLDTHALLFYSSGTTGLPKGIIHTQRTCHYNAENMRSHFLHEVYPVLGVSDVDWYQDCHIITSGCFHLLGFGILSWCLITGAQAIIMKQFDEVLYPELVSQFKPRYLVLSPPIVAFFAKHHIGIAATLESVQMILCCAAPLSEEISDEFLVHHSNVKYVVQGFGLTETGSSNLPLLLRKGTDASSGVIASGYEQKIVVSGTIPYTRGQWGEVYTKGPGMAVGYHKSTNATKQLVDDQGWFHTGDVGYFNEFGSLCIVDRMKELIKVNYGKSSLQVAPAQLEGVLLTCPAIRDVAVVGVPHEAGGELVRAFVVKEEQHLTHSDVEQFIADKLAPHNRITGGVVFIEAIPRSPSGKILRRELREIH
ncbi:hypothetical protein PENTCL1PPCAC_4997, partial [Pristionchus entomophagus]